MSNKSVKEELEKIAGKIRNLGRETAKWGGETFDPEDLLKLCDNLDREITQIDVIYVDQPTGPINIITPGVIDEWPL